MIEATPLMAHTARNTASEPRAAALQASRSAKRHKQAEENQYPQGVERHGAIRRGESRDQRAAERGKE
jgi:hypothetical protein